MHTWDIIIISSGGSGCGCSSGSGGGGSISSSSKLPHQRETTVFSLNSLNCTLPTGPKVSTAWCLLGC
jgi:hypothetical protein